MLERLFTDKLISPSDLEPSHDGLEVIGVFNPGVVRFGGKIIIAARVVERPTETRDGFYASPRYTGGSYAVDWLPCDNTDAGSDPRCYFTRDTGALRLRFISHMRIFESADGRSVTHAADALRVMPQGEYEQYGIEDPRITVIGDGSGAGSGGGTAYITYVAVSMHGVCTCLMSTTDFKQFHRHGIIFCPDNKDVVLFPEKILGSYVAMHRPMPSMPFSPPKVWIGRSNDLIHWGAHRQLIINKEGPTDHHRDRVGGGTPPVKTDRGWLTIYHGSDKKPGAKGAGRYTAGALLLDLANPAKVIARSDGPIMVPELPFETNGFVNNIVFPTAIVEDGDRYLVYNGAADEHTTVVGYDKKKLLGSIKAV